MPEREFYDDDYHSVSSETSSHFYKPTATKDSRTHYYERPFYDEKKRREIMKNVQCFSSGDVGSTIRNAQYGTYYKYVRSKESGAFVLITNDATSYSFSQKDCITHTVGSSNEDLYFKVKMPGIVSKDSEKTSVTLFYNSPGQFERHMNIEVSNEAKQQWNEKRKLQMMKSDNKFLF